MHDEATNIRQEYRQFWRNALLGLFGWSDEQIETWASWFDREQFRYWSVYKCDPPEHLLADRLAVENARYILLWRECKPFRNRLEEALRFPPGTGPGEETVEAFAAKRLAVEAILCEIRAMSTFTQAVLRGDKALDAHFIGIARERAARDLPPQQCLNHLAHSGARPFQALMALVDAYTIAPNDALDAMEAHPKWKDEGLLYRSATQEFLHTLTNRTGP